ncbi:hypothetical protein [Thalassobaculum litoreum]|uniref:Uncharacterized protein n=1 Tax=Thalassobaculum litoreum DSM 18839 TaxID=1123362 RepID=A0A8G2EXD5_9PROT|nr:hypothetical protein [Thalassobaculum litoreum]SDG62255.1 hypothetical protein SAMN05660686_05050 [Thalassobaculum litoreum DSM 18839]
MEDLKPGDPIPSEDKERVNMVAQHIIAPALHRAIEHARTKAPINEVLSATANAYAGILSDIVGRPAAAKLMAAHADHLEKLTHSSGN